MSSPSGPPVRRLTLLLLLLACGGDGAGPSNGGGPALAVTTLPDSIIAKVPAAGLRVEARRDGIVDTTFTGLVDLRLAQNPPGAQLLGDTARAVRGVATFPALRVTLPGAGYVVEATASGAAPGLSAPFAVLPTPVTGLRFVVAPIDEPAGDAMSPAVEVEAVDLAGDRAGTFMGTVTLSLLQNPGSDTLRGTLSRPLQNGVARFDNLALRVAAAGYQVRAVSAGLQNAVTPSFAVVGNVPARLRWAVQPGTTEAGAPITPDPAVELLDAWGNLSQVGAAQTVSLALVGAGAGLTRAISAVSSGSGATFGNVAVDSARAGLTLVAQAPGLVPDTSLPFTTTGRVYRSVSVGGTHECAVTTGDYVRCRGTNFFGELADGSAYLTSGLLTVQSGYPRRWRHFPAGEQLSCGLATSGGVYCYGNLGGTGPHQVPINITLPAAVDSVQVRGGDGCGLATAGAVICWAGNVAGVVAGLPPLRQLSVGRSYNCGLAADSTAYCWGILFIPALSPTPIFRSQPSAVPGALKFASVAAGYSLVCGLTGAGAAWCWGRNEAGQLGNGSQVADTVPQLVVGGHVFAQLAVGGGAVCALTSAGAAWCWGDNTFGSLGGGSQGGFSAVPVAVTGGHQFTQLSVGPASHPGVCGLDTGGRVWCWGVSTADQGVATPTPFE